MKGSYLNDAFFSRLEALALNLRTDLAGFFGGKHLVKSYGQTVEFADYREYMLGDDIRRIDWNLYSRFEKYFLKLFTDERQMHVRIFLDCSASMGRANPQKGNYAIAVGAAIGFLAIHNMDKVSFQLIKGDRAENPFGTMIGKNAYFRAIGELENVTFEGEYDLAEAITGSPDNGSNDGLTVIISDFFSEKDWKKAVDYLCYKKRQVMLIQVLSPEEADPAYNGRVNLIDSESETMDDARNVKVRITKSMLDAYNEALRDMMGDIRSFSMSRGVDYITLHTDKPIERMLFGELLKVGVMG